MPIFFGSLFSRFLTKVIVIGEVLNFDNTDEVVSDFNDIRMKLFIMIVLL